MSLPFFSCICLTAGRVPLLEEAIAAFARQDYQGQSELIVLNTLPEQRLDLDGYENVRILNLNERPPSLGAARNMATQTALGNWCITWDDDDQYLPNHLSNFAAHAEGNEWLWQTKQFYMLSGKIKAIVQGSANVLAFTKAAWEKVGRYQNMNCGEDRNLVGRITAQCKGQRVELDDSQISFLYAWGQGVYHQSGQGDDRPGQLTSWARAGRELDRQIARRAIPVGKIALKPKLLRDYGKMALAFLAQANTVTKSSPDKSDVAVVLLGRIGDIINLLPVLRHIAENYAKPNLVVAREFLPLLDGVSYVEPYPVDLPPDKLKPAIALANKHFKHVIVAQPWANDRPIVKKTEAYNLESWTMAGFGHKFRDTTWSPVFDRRNLQREDALFQKLDVWGRPLLLVKLDGSVSSPCPECPKLLPTILNFFSGNFNVVDLSLVRSERIYDLLGLFSRAACLLTIDTSLLHLAAASAVPVVALVNPRPWLGTLPRARCERRFTYSEAIADPGKVIEAVTQATLAPSLEMGVVEIRQPPKRRIFHVYEALSECDARKAKARLTWRPLYDAGVVPRPASNLPRDATLIGDKRKLPFLKDLLQHTILDATMDDLIMLTNDDVALHPSLADQLLFQAGIYGPVSSQRCEFKRQLPPMSRPPAAFAMLGAHHMGRDLFCFPKIWLVSHWGEIPDFLLGASAWDLCLACMVRLHYGIATTRQNIVENIYPAELERGYVAHQAHKAVWSQPQNRNSVSEKYNKALFRNWAAKHLPALKFNPNNEI